MGGDGPIEVAKTVIEVADVAWKAMEFSQHHRHHEIHQHESANDTKSNSLDEELESLRSENKRLRNLLEHNLKLLQNLSESPCLLNDCPPNLYSRLVATVDSENFSTKLESLRQASVNETGIQFPLKEATGDDMQLVEILINVDNKEPSRWVWVSEDMVPSNVEERSGIDDENYVVVTEENVVDGLPTSWLNALWRTQRRSFGKSFDWCEQIGKSVRYLACWDHVLYSGDLGAGFGRVEEINVLSCLSDRSMSTLFLLLKNGFSIFFTATISELYRSRAVLRLAAKGIHTTSKVVLKALLRWPFQSE